MPGVPSRPWDLGRVLNLARRVRRSLIVTAMIAVSCAQAAADRLETLGEAMICMCRSADGGCGQLLSECNMIGCPVSEPMRRELKGQIALGMNDPEILAAFSEKYGVKLTIVEGASGGVYQRLMQDMQMGAARADVLSTATVGQFIDLKKKGQFMYWLGKPA